MFYIWNPHKQRQFKIDDQDSDHFFCFSGCPINNVPSFPEHLHRTSKIKSLYTWNLGN